MAPLFVKGAGRALDGLICVIRDCQGGWVELTAKHSMPSMFLLLIGSLLSRMQRRGAEAQSRRGSFKVAKPTEERPEFSTTR